MYYLTYTIQGSWHQRFLGSLFTIFFLGYLFTGLLTYPFRIIYIYLFKSTCKLLTDKTQRDVEFFNFISHGDQPSNAFIQNRRIKHEDANISYQGL